MKALICEMCGSKDVVKKDGNFVCEFCGTKYSVEEAKKMMIEGTVDVRVDETSKIDNFFKMAESAIEAGNQAEAENYCNKIIEINPTDHRAWFLKGKAAGWQSTTRKNRIEESVTYFTNAIENAPEGEIEKVKEDVSNEISRLSLAFISLCCNHFAEYPSEDNESAIYGSILTAKKHSMLLLKKCGAEAKMPNEKISALMNGAVCDAWNNVITKDYVKSDKPSKYVWETYTERCRLCINILSQAIDFSEDDKEGNIQRYKNAIDILSKMVDSCSYRYDGSVEYTFTKEGKQTLLDNIERCKNKLKELDPSYVAPVTPEKSGGCYVATAVYGSYDCPQVWTLRRYRDNTLAGTWYGRAFIRTYYAISPTLVKWFGETEWFKKMWKGKLDRMVEDLQADGVESTPYEDKKW